MSKAPRSSKEMYPSNNSSPALPPKPPRPSPARNGSALSQFHDKSHGHDQGSNIKRKINWDTPTDHVLMPATLETSSADSGVKVNTITSWLFVVIMYFGYSRIIVVQKNLRNVIQGLMLT